MSFSFKIIVLLVVALGVWVLVAPLLAKRLIIEKGPERADAILVLGGSSVYVERTQRAAVLFKRGAAPKIFLSDDGKRSGWSRIKEENPPFVELAREELIRQGVPTGSIEILAPVVAGTDDEAAVLLEKARAEDLRSVLIVTSAYHTRRALWVFEKAFRHGGRPETRIGMAAAPTGQQTPPPWTWWLSPRGWQLVAGEYVKTLYYWVYY